MVDALPPFTAPDPSWAEGGADPGSGWHGPTPRKKDTDEPASGREGGADPASGWHGPGSKKKDTDGPASGVSGRARPASGLPSALAEEEKASAVSFNPREALSVSGYAFRYTLGYKTL